MNMKSLAVAALAASSLIALPVAAQAEKARGAAVSKTSVVRKNSSHVEGVSNTGIIVGVVALAALAAGIAVASDNKKAKSP